jgi:hypothetical protein
MRPCGGSAGRHIERTIGLERIREIAAIPSVERDCRPRELVLRRAPQPVVERGDGAPAGLGDRRPVPRRTDGDPRRGAGFRDRPLPPSRTGNGIDYVLGAW